MTLPRFVLLEHDHPTLHWDLMLEEGDSLRTWRLPSPRFGGEPMEATSLAPHRLAYLDYEGPVSGGRGSVKRVDAGTYSHEGDWDGIEGTLELAGQRHLMRVSWRRDGEGWFFGAAPKLDSASPPSS
ncbi:MAG: DNA polymerase ligase N-terminal domain-containing protein [Gemmataceae bacterium]